MTKPQLDQIDREIIDHFSRDARISNRAVADVLGITEGTVRARLKRLREVGLVRFTALTNLSRLGTMHILFIRVKVDLQRVRHVARSIAEMDEIKCVVITTGTHNILAMCSAQDIADTLAVLTTKIGALDGVRSMETSIALRNVKYNASTAKILPGPVAGEEATDEEA